MTETVVRIAARGDGVTGSGRHMPFTAPGDLVQPDGIVLPGPHRAVPPCRHFPECGGCQLQHVDDIAYGRFLQDRIVSALAAQGVPAPDLLPPHISPPVSRRRASLRAERRGSQVRLGFNAEKSHRIVDMRECFILRTELFALVEPLRTLMGHLLGPRGSGGVRMTLADQGADILLDKVSVEGLEATERLAEFAATYRLARLAIDDGYGPQTRWEPEPVTVTLGRRHPGESRDPGTRARRASGSVDPPPTMSLGPGEGQPRHPGESRDLSSEKTPAQLLPEAPASAGATGVPVPLPHGAFLQATAEGEEALVESVRAAVGPGRLVADLFAGLGTFALSLDGRVYAAEGDRDAAAAMKLAADRAQRPVFVDHRDLYRRPLDASELGRFEAVLLDPPRAGAREQIALLARSSVPRIAYVSCNPNTFARDAKTLIDGGYRFDWVKPVGQFRWSTHVELAAAFTR
ncbi:MAG TPA: class I SAM-dependent RNA methyltransferase [Allosphingosinicella sp.]|nr:class I SAM-dependent RNA methyltransferase [Allosphingosinicella sp.]